jgi:uncharacterized protein
VSNNEDEISKQLTTMALFATIVSRATTGGRLIRRRPGLHIRNNDKKNGSCVNSTSGSTRTTSSSSNTVVAPTHKWFETVVVAEKLCPFAPPLLRNSNLLRIVHSTATTSQEVVRDVAAEVRLLVGEESSSMSTSTTTTPSTTPSSPPWRHETTLVVLDDRQSPFVTDFRDFVRLSWQLQEEAVGEEFVHLLQLVLFHPNATHQTYASNEVESAADYTIRSPYPTIHLLREVDVLKAVQGGYPNLEELPSRNKEKLLRQGTEWCAQRLRACYYKS